jgi:hypothetical protein
MPERESPQNEKCKGTHDQDRKFYSAGFVLVVMLGLVILGVVASLSAYLYVQGARDWISFLMASLLNALIFMAIVFQAFIYSKQWDTMRDSVKQAERSAKIAEDAFYVGEAPYFGIAKIAPEGFSDNDAPLIKITFINGGKTPAWHVHTQAKAIVGQTPEDEQFYLLDPKWHDLENTFFTMGDCRTLEYQNDLFRYSSALEEKLLVKDVQIFLIIRIHYRDFRKVWHGRDFRLVWDNNFRNFKDYDAEKKNCPKCKKIERPS